MPTSLQVPSKLAAHEHACHFYYSKEDLLKVTVPYILYGLARGEKCLYAVDDLTADDFRDVLSFWGCDVRRCEKSQQLEILTTRSTYFGFGMFSEAAMIAYYRAYIPAVLAGKFPAARIAVEVSDALVTTGALKEFISYESKTQELFPSFPVSAICAYNANKFPESFLNAVAQSHPYQMAAECPYVVRSLSRCYHLDRRPELQDKAAEYCFNTDHRYLSCSIFQEFEETLPQRSYRKTNPS